jgi:hypothetical protein
VLSRHDFAVIPLTSGDYARAAELVRKYADLPLGGVSTSRSTPPLAVSSPDASRVTVASWSNVWITAGAYGVTRTRVQHCADIAVGTITVDTEVAGSSHG